MFVECSQLDVVYLESSRWTGLGLQGTLMSVLADERLARKLPVASGTVVEGWRMLGRCGRRPGRLMRSTTESQRCCSTVKRQLTCWGRIFLQALFCAMEKWTDTTFADLSKDRPKLFEVVSCDDSGKGTFLLSLLSKDRIAVFCITVISSLFAKLPSQFFALLPSLFSELALFLFQLFHFLFSYAYCHSIP